VIAICEKSRCFAPEAIERMSGKNLEKKQKGKGYAILAVTFVTGVTG